jgi:tetratricopeptide (TPR) repeat protein
VSAQPATDRADQRHPRAQEWLCAVALCAAVVAAYAPVRGAGFIWDDDMHITQNPCIVGPLGLADIWTSRAARYFPLVLTTFWAEHAAWGLNPHAYHAMNVLMHAACAVALWRVLRALAVPGALLGAALWALHPVQVESVAWITELKNTESGLFYLLCVLFYVKSLRGGPGGAGAGPLPYAAALLFAALAMASKSSTVVLPVVLALCAWWVRGTVRRGDLARLAPVVAMSAAAAALSLWTQHLEGANDPGWVRGVPERIADAGMAFWFYLGKLAWPHPLVFIYPRWDVDWTRPASYAPTAAMLAVVLLLWWRRAGALRPAFMAFAYFLAALGPVLTLLDQYFWRYSLVGDHFQYLASMGPLALAASAATAAARRAGRAARAAAVAACAALLAALGALSWAQCSDYRDSDTLWRSTIALNPGCWMAHNNLGASYLESGRLEEAAAEFRAALGTKGGDLEARQNLGNTFTRMGRLDEAIAQYRAALAIDPGFDKAHNGLGDALLQSGRVTEAIAQFEEALRINPGFAGAEENYGDALFREGHPDMAIGRYRRALALDPGSFQAHSNLGTALLAMRRGDEALGEFRRALDINPRFAAAMVNIGNVLLGQGNAAQAEGFYARALEIAPDLAEAHNNLGAALIEEGRLEDAVAHCRRALEINPDYPEAHANLGRALFKLGRVGEADAQFQEAARPR